MSSEVSSASAAFAVSIFCDASHLGLTSIAAAALRRLATATTASDLVEAAVRAEALNCDALRKELTSQLADMAYLVFSGTAPANSSNSNIHSTAKLGLGHYPKGCHPSTG
eukprot:GHVT01028154.1.p1 GENE.GHVT01028154.1~~GHVT01028154.1.p1  ORF type:complete len:110 (+),score=30.77 GHVT01028154.1:612-941(+)